MTYFVYILLCSDKSYYTGITNNLHRRHKEHEEGTQRNSYTYPRRPTVLVYHAQFTLPEKAIEFEKRIKKWSKSKKQALINGEFEKLPNLSKKQF